MPEQAYLIDLVDNKKLAVITPKCRVGRDPLNDIVLKGDQTLSRFQFTIAKKDDQYLIEPVVGKSTTYVDQIPLKAATVLKDGAVIKVGVSLYWFTLENSSSALEAKVEEPKGKFNIREAIQRWISGKKS